MKIKLLTIAERVPDRTHSLLAGAACFALLAVLSFGPAWAQYAPSASPAPAPAQAAAAVTAPAIAKKADAAPPKAGAQPVEVRSYCENIANAAADARFAWQTEKLADLELKVKVRIAELEAKTAELKATMAKREDLQRKATEKLVGIYAKMRPETAATQIADLDDAMAAAVLSQLAPGKASAIFNEIAPDRAAKLATLITGISPPTEDKKL